MSAIFGVYPFAEHTVDSAVLHQMDERLAHCGPDAAKIWRSADGSIGLGHRMLWTTPESLHESLPLVSEGGRFVITADVRLDNRKELISRLHLDKAAMLTDGALVLAAYKRWGMECPSQLLGAFAFAIWDGSEQTLFCARDHFGIKPFYYAHIEHRLFAFASEIKGVLCVPQVSKALDEIQIADFLAMIDHDKTNTFYAAVRRLPPAHWLLLKPGTVRCHPYWTLELTEELQLKSDDAYAEIFREHFFEAVRCRLRSAKPVGALLSGGLDSSSVASVAQMISEEGGHSALPSFSAIFDTVPECDEREYINAVLTYNQNLRSTFIPGDTFGPLNDFRKVGWHQDAPLHGSSDSLVWVINQAVQNHGVGVILSGWDGDSTVSHGTGYLLELAHSGRWLTLAREAHLFQRRFGGTASPWWEISWSYVWNIGMKHTTPPPTPKELLQTMTRKVLNRLLPPAFQLRSLQKIREEGFLDPVWVHDLRYKERIAALLADEMEQPRTEREAHLRRLTLGGMVRTLELDAARAAAFGIEQRYPFWDKRLIELCLSLPPQQKLYQGWIRMVMRRAMQGFLPEVVRWRGGKMNMKPVFEYGFPHYHRSLVEEVFQDLSYVAPFVNVPALRSAFTLFSQHAASEGQMLAVWRSVSLSLWLRDIDVAKSETVESRMNATNVF